MKESKDPGLGTSYSKSLRRSLKEDGNFNIKRVGAIGHLRDIYKYLIELPSYKFTGFFIFSFFGLNALFALIYLLIGVDQLQGLSEEQHPFWGAFYFSSQTFTTVGYGAISPRGNASSFVAAIEAFMGLIFFSMATGLIYGRFSRPSAKIGFSHNVIITPHKDGTALMFKIVHRRNNTLLNCKVHVTLSIAHEDPTQHVTIRQYYSLPLETDFVRFFPLTWTLVHQINDDSPFYGLSVQELRNRTAELLVLVEAFDETYAQKVIQKHSYAEDQWLDNVKFKRNFHVNEEGEVVLHIHELDEVEAI